MKKLMTYHPLKLKTLICLNKSAVDRKFSHVRTKTCPTMRKACATIATTLLADLEMQKIVNTKKKRIMQKVYVSIAISIIIVKQERWSKVDYLFNQ